MLLNEENPLSSLSALVKDVKDEEMCTSHTERSDEIARARGLKRKQQTERRVVMGTFTFRVQ